MKTRFSFALCAAILCAWPSLRAQACDHVIGLSVSVADGRGNYKMVQPGDTVCITAGSRNSLILRNFQGASSAPILFRNEGGAAVFDGSNGFALKFQNSRYFRLTGTGTAGTSYGFQVRGTYTFGLNLGDKSSDMEIDHVQISGTSGAGIKAYTHSTCSDGSDNSYDYDGDGRIAYDVDDVVSHANFTQYNTVLHDNYIRNTGKEGLYVGLNRTVNESASHSISPGPCPTPPTYPLNPLLENVRVYKNRVERSGWDSINVKGSSKCQVHSNEVVENSTANDPGQEGGINIAENSSCDVFNNLVRDGFSRGIKLSGTGGRVFNNVVVNAGRSYGPGDAQGTAIDVSSPYVGTPYLIVNNTLVAPTNIGVYFAYSSQSGNRVQNNVIVSPGAYQSSGDRAYVWVVGSAAAQVTNNYKTLNLGSLVFTNPTAFDYSLRSGSPAIDQGLDLTAHGVTFDRSGKSRPIGPGFDIGAYEFGSTTTQPPTPPTNLHILNIVP